MHWICYILVQIRLMKKKNSQSVTQLTLVDKMRKNEMDRASVVEDPEWTRLRPQRDVHMDEKNGRTDNVKPVHTAFNLRRGVILVSQ